MDKTSNNIAFNSPFPGRLYSGEYFPKGMFVHFKNLFIKGKIVDSPQISVIQRDRIQRQVAGNHEFLKIFHQTDRQIICCQNRLAAKHSEHIEGAGIIIGRMQLSGFPHMLDPSFNQIKKIQSESDLLIPSQEFTKCITDICSIKLSDRTIKSFPLFIKKVFCFQQQLHALRPGIIQSNLTTSRIPFTRINFEDRRNKDGFCIAHDFHLTGTQRRWHFWIFVIQNNLCHIKLI